MKKIKTKKRVGLGNGCPLYKKCGGCQLQNMPYEEQLHFKQARAIKLLGKFGRVSEIIGMEEPYHYRCKVQAAFGMRSGEIISGVYQSSTHRIVPVTDCMIEDQDADRIIAAVRRLTAEFRLGVFDERVQKGFLRHVLIRKGYYTGQIMVVLVTGTKAFPKHRDFVNRLLEIHPEITTVVQNFNDRFTALVLGESFTTLYGNGYIEDRIADCVFRISPASFYQVNPRQTQVLYRTAIDYLDLTGRETVIDAYCGTGTIGILAARKAGTVIGVEQNASAVKDAMINAKINKIDNIRFFCADASDFLCSMAKEGESVDAVIMDPPRSGSTPEFIHAVCEVEPKKIAYISCNPETLARDLYLFVRGGYKVRKIQPIDMFPHTNHCEVVCMMSEV